MTTEYLILISGFVFVALGLGGVLWIVVRKGSEDSPEIGGLIEDLKTSMAVSDSSLQMRVSELNVKMAALQEMVTSGEAVLDERVRSIGSHVAGIAGLFANDRARGGWGEISMIRIFELCGLTEGRDYTSQFNAGDKVPDAVVHLPGGRSVVIDSKFPAARYNEALATDDEVERHRLLSEQGKELERLGRAIANRGYSELATGDYIVMYLPSQAVFEAAAAASPEVIERLMLERVVVAGPTSLFALIASVGALVTEHRGLQQADQILSEARVLHERLTTFLGHLQGVGSSLSRTVLAFNSAVGSWASRVGPQLTRISELNGFGESFVMEPVDDSVREIVLVDSEVRGSLDVAS